MPSSTSYVRSTYPTEEETLMALGDADSEGTTG